MRTGILSASGTLGSQQKTLDPQGLELQKVVSHQVDAGNGTQVFWKNSQRNHSQLFSSPPKPLTLGAGRDFPRLVVQSTL